MGKIQESVNNALSGTAFLLNQSGVTERIRAKYEYKTRLAENNFKHDEMKRGIKEQIDGLKYNDRDGIEAYNMQLDALNKELDEIEQKRTASNLSLKKESPYESDRKEAFSQEGQRQGKNASDEAYKMAIAYRKERDESHQRAETAKNTLLEVLKNPNASKEDVLNAIKEKNDSKAAHSENMNMYISRQIERWMK